MKPIRMCVNCRDRKYQSDMIRLVCNNKKVEKFNGNKRSFYICNDCIENKNLWKKFITICKVDKIKSKEIMNNLKENIVDEIKN